MKMTKALLLFDIDGTLLRTEGAGMRAMLTAFRRLYGHQFTMRGVEVSGYMDPLIFADAMAINGLAHDPAQHVTFRDTYVAQLREDLGSSRERAAVIDGISDVLGMLRRRADQRRDVVLGLLTGNYTAAAPVKLTAAGIETGWFRVTAFGDEAPTRPDLVPLAMGKYQRLVGERAEPRGVVVIGDTPRDVACAKAHGCTAFAVATGRFGVDELRDAGADIVARDLTDPAPLIDLIDSIQARRLAATT